MPLPPPRDGRQRVLDVRARLAAQVADVWVATASADGVAHLVPLSLAWDGERVILALESTSLTARNVTASGRARLAAGETRDVVIIDALLDAVLDLDDAPPQLAEAYVMQAGWDPRTAGEGQVFLILRPDRIQAWREANELRGRTVMRSGKWLY
jgi:pyridoxamine 5'-phosphate oxidase-like protein